MTHVCVPEPEKQRTVTLLPVGWKAHVEGFEGSISVYEDSDGELTISASLKDRGIEEWVGPVTTTHGDMDNDVRAVAERTERLVAARWELTNARIAAGRQP